MTKAELITSLSEKTGLAKNQVNEVLKSLVDSIVDEVKSGGSISLPGLGTYSLNERPARKGRNPRTGEDMDIPASKTMKFKVSKTVKDALN